MLYRSHFLTHVCYDPTSYVWLGMSLVPFGPANTCNDSVWPVLPNLYLLERTGPLHRFLESPKVFFSLSYSDMTLLFIVFIASVSVFCERMVRAFQVCKCPSNVISLSLSQLLDSVSDLFTRDVQRFSCLVKTSAKSWVTWKWRLANACQYLINCMIMVGGRWFGGRFNAPSAAAVTMQRFCLAVVLVAAKGRHIGRRILRSHSNCFQLLSFRRDFFSLIVLRLQFFIAAANQMSRHSSQMTNRRSGLAVNFLGDQVSSLIRGPG